MKFCRKKKTIVNNADMSHVFSEEEKMLLIWKFSTDQSWKMRVLIKSLRNNTAEDTKMIFKSLIGRQIKGKAKQIF